MKRKWKELKRLLRSCRALDLFILCLKWQVSTRDPRSTARQKSGLVVRDAYKLCYMVYILSYSVVTILD